MQKEDPSSSAMTPKESANRDAVEVFAKSLEGEGLSNVRFALDQAMCCSGYMCGCRGSTVGEYLAYEARQLLSGEDTIPAGEEAVAQANGAIAQQLEQALIDRNEDHFRTIAFVYRHQILAALKPSSGLREALVECRHQLNIVRPRDGYDRAFRCSQAIEKADTALASVPGDGR